MNPLSIIQKSLNILLRYLAPESQMKVTTFFGSFCSRQ